MDPNVIIQTISIWALPILLALTFHEAAHATMAYLCGDRTAWSLGRVSLNPLRHIDPFGTIILPLLGIILGGGIFGWAKPVPVNPRNYHHPRRDDILVSIAGPAANIFVAMGALTLLTAHAFLPEFAHSWYTNTLAVTVEFNVTIAIFNMLPIPPLDGGHVLINLLPYPYNNKLRALAPSGMGLIIIGFLILPRLLRVPSPFYYLVAIPSAWLTDLLFLLFGFTLG